MSNTMSNTWSHTDKQMILGSMQETAKTLTTYFAAIALDIDDSKTFKEHKELWEAKEKIEKAVELVASLTIFEYIKSKVCNNEKL